MIINQTDQTPMNELFQQAQTRGIDRPVLLSFVTGPRAMAVYTQLSGEPWKQPKRGLPGPTSEVLAHTVGEAAAALRNHAGLGGRLVANLIDSASSDADGWYLNFNVDRIAVLSYWEWQGLSTGYISYDRLPHCEICPCCADKPGPFPLAVPVAGGTDLFLQLPQASQVSLAMTLSKVAVSRRLPETIQRTIEPSDPLEFPVGDSELAMILADFYSDSPEVIAEVLRALGRENHSGREWLLQTLRTTPGLTNLAQKVDRLIGAKSAG